MRSQQEKYLEYARAGVQEYWLMDTDKKDIEVYVLRGGVYEPLGRFISGQKAFSELLPGFEVEVEQVLGRFSECLYSGAFSSRRSQHDAPDKRAV